MKNIPVSCVRLIVIALLGLSLSACVTTDTNRAVYYSPGVSTSHQIYGYNAVDFRALDVDY